MIAAATILAFALSGTPTTPPAPPACAPWTAPSRAPSAALAEQADRRVEAIEAALPGRPDEALREAQRRLSEASSAGDGPRANTASSAFGRVLAAHCAAAARRPLPAPTAEDRRVLAEVYARPELRRSRADPAALGRSLLRLWMRLLELLGTAEAERYASVGRFAYLAAALVAGVAGLAALRRRRARHPAARVASEPTGSASPPAPDRSATLAEEALRAGAPAEAVRLAFLSALAALEASRMLPRDRSLTNAELAARLPAAGPCAEDFARLALSFDGAVYGARVVAEAEARGALEAARRVRAAAGGTA